LRNARTWQEATLKYKIVMNKSEEGYSVSCPGLPGCWSQGETEEEAIKNILSAIQEYMAAIDDSIKGADVREVEVTT
jgi:predicted RNase H-like HicB family nuclease